MCGLKANQKRISEACGTIVSDLKEDRKSRDQAKANLQMVQEFVGSDSIFCWNTVDVFRLHIKSKAVQNPNKPWPKVSSDRVLRESWELLIQN